MKKHRGSKIKKSALGSLLFGVLFSFAMLIIISFVSSALLMASKNPGGSIKVVSFAVLLITAAVSGFTVSKYKGEGGVVTSLISSVISVIIMLGISIICSGGKVGGVIFMNYLCYVLIAAFTAFLGKKRERRHRHR